MSIRFLSATDKSVAADYLTAHEAKRLVSFGDKLVQIGDFIIVINCDEVIK